ncbi:MAG: hypothetical protein ACREA0_30935 [bacterium]
MGTHALERCEDFEAYSGALVSVHAALRRAIHGQLRRASPGPTVTMNPKGRRSVGRHGKRWVARVRKGVPPGPQGQPDIRAGDELQVVQVVEWAALGKVAFPVPQASSLLLDAGRQRLSRALRLKTGLHSQTSTKGAIPGTVDRSFTNADALFDFFSEAMGGIVLCHAALDSYANESRGLRDADRRGYAERKATGATRTRTSSEFGPLKCFEQAEPHD